MALPPVVDSLDKVHESNHEHYTKQDDGKFHLQHTETPPWFEPKARVDEFRTNNRNLNTELTNVKTELERFKDVDVDEYNRFKSGEGVKTVFDEAEHERRVEALKTEHKQEVDGHTTTIAGLNGELDQAIVVTGVQEAAIAANALEGAIPDIVNRLTPQLSRKDGQPVVVRKGADGSEEVQYGADGKLPKGPKDLVTELKSGDGAHLFKGSSGDGANNTTTAAGSGGTVQVTREQMKDVNEYSRIKEKAKKNNQTLEIVEET